MDWERFNDQFRETEEERNERLRELRLGRATEQQARRAFYETETGKLLRRFEAALGRAWVTDQREHSSNAAVDRDWAAADAARDALIAHLEARSTPSPSPEEKP